MVKGKQDKQIPRKPPKGIVVPDSLKESFALTTARRKIGIYGERFVDVLNQAVKQEKTGNYSGGIMAIERCDDGSRIVQFSMKRLMSSELDHNYDDAEDAMRKLEATFFEYRKDGIWKSCALVTEPVIDEVNHIGRFRVPSDIWVVLSDYNTYRTFQPTLAFKLSSDYAYRLYKLVAGQKRPLPPMRIEELRLMLGVGQKNKRLGDFQTRILEPARQQLMKEAEWFFDYELRISKEKQLLAKRGRPSPDLIIFYPKFNAAVANIQATADVYANGDVARILPDALHAELKHRYGFTDEEIRNSHIILEAYDIMAQNKESLLAFIQDSKEAIDRARGDKKALLLGYIKRHIRTVYDIPLGKDKQGDEGQAPTLPNIFTKDEIKRGGQPSGIGDILKRQ